jgi:hypothetical protein
MEHEEILYSVAIWTLLNELYQIKSNECYN